MATVTIRNLEERVKQGLRMRAVEHGCSMEAEARSILAEAVGVSCKSAGEGVIRVRGKWMGRVRTDDVMRLTREDQED